MADTPTNAVPGAYVTGNKYPLVVLFSFAVILFSLLSIIMIISLFICIENG